jgi:hypothetical protein
VDWPAEKKAIDIGDFYADSSLIGQTLGWKPRTSLADGLQSTIAFYRAHFAEYVPSTDAAPVVPGGSPGPAGATGSR